MGLTSGAVSINQPGLNQPPPLTQLIVMCYQGAIADLEKAREFHRSGMADAAYDKVRHAQDIITELLVGLDYERGGQLAQNLSRIYNFILRELIGIHTRRETSCYDQLIQILDNLKGAWEQVG